MQNLISMLIGRLIYETLCATEVLASFRRCNGLFLLARLCSLGELSHAQKELQVFRPKPTGTSDELSAGHIAQRRAVERAFIARQAPVAGSLAFDGLCVRDCVVRNRNTHLKVCVSVYEKAFGRAKVMQFTFCTCCNLLL